MFIDTNVLIKARILEAPDHAIARERLSRALQEPEPLRISRQLVREHLPVVTRGQRQLFWPAAITREEAIEDARQLLDSFEVLEDGPISPSLCFRCVVRSR